MTGTTALAEARRRDVARRWQRVHQALAEMRAQAAEITGVFADATQNRRPWNLTRYRLRGEVFAMGLSGSSTVPTQLLRARLADMKCSTDGAYRGKAVGRQVSCEHDCGRARRADLPRRTSSPCAGSFNHRTRVTARPPTLRSS
jgi:hypothetical protein